MNMVSLLALGLVLHYNIGAPRVAAELVTGARVVGIIVAVICVIAIAWSIWQSKRESGDLVESEVKAS
jgi:K(+)-stimulated pyrophosphate-energized sodium pump